MSKRIVQNKIQCANCKAIVESKHRHDFAVCDCWDTFDVPFTGVKSTGGPGWTKEYLEHCAKYQRGVFTDGGKDYIRRGGRLTDIIDMSIYEE